MQEDQLQVLNQMTKFRTTAEKLQNQSLNIEIGTRFGIGIGLARLFAKAHLMNSGMDPYTFSEVD